MKNAIYIILLCVFGTAFLTTSCNNCKEKTWYQDLDDDGLGNPNSSIVDCDQPVGYVSNSDDANDNTDFAKVIKNISENVIVSTYNDLNQKANNLLVAVQDLQANPTQANLSKAQIAWVAARVPWESSEGFLFGPVDTEGIDPALDSWPVNKVDLELVLDGSDNLTVTFVEGLDGTLKGFHTIEFLIFGEDGNKQVADLSARDFEYLISSASVLADDAEKLAVSWNATQGNFVSNLLNAGENGSIYVSKKSVLEELTGGIIGIADEVGNGKINDPLAEEDFTLEESQFSDNSKTDFTNNIRSIQNVYLGIGGAGLTEIVQEFDVALDAQIKEDINNAIDAIQNIPGTFTDAIPASSPTRKAAEDAQQAVRDLQSTLESKLLPLITAL